MELGKTQKLKVIRKSKIGATLENGLLLPENEITDPINEGDWVDVFIYKDSEDRPIATMKTPKIQLGTFAILKVVDTTKFGAFLDWGLAKDLFLPFKEQMHPVKKGDWVPVSCYIDHSNRLAATSRIKNRFPKAKDLKINQYVNCQVYSIHEKYGAFVIVEEKYNGLIPKEKCQKRYRIGEWLRARVEYIKSDGKVSLSTLTPAAQRTEDKSMVLLEHLKENHGFLPVNDHTEPEKIYKLFHMSKGDFKKAVGHLLKEKKIHFENGGISLNEVDKSK